MYIANEIELVVENILYEYDSNIYINGHKTDYEQYNQTRGERTGTF